VTSVVEIAELAKSGIRSRTVQLTDRIGRRLIVPFGALTAVLLIGTAGYYYLGGGRWTVFECLYQAVTTLTTVGFGELLEGMDSVPWAREFTALLIIAGVGVFLYVVSTFTATIIEGDLQRALRKTRMRNRISKLDGHVVVCGAGSTGTHVVEELIAANRPCVAIDLDQQTLERGAQQWGEDRFLYVVGDATDDAVLHAANVARASGVVASLPNDKDNLYLVVATRLINPSARVVARGGDVRMLDKLRKAGADTVVSPNLIGGMRMVSELLRPHVVRFLDEMLRDRTGNWRIEEVSIPKGSVLAGQTLQQADLRHGYEVVVLAVRSSDGRYSYNPTAGFALEEESTLIVLGRLDRVDALRQHLQA
jgi:voltage-gated potassium channel